MRRRPGVRFHDPTARAEAGERGPQASRPHVSRRPGGAVMVDCLAARAASAGRTAASGGPGVRSPLSCGSVEQFGELSGTARSPALFSPAWGARSGAPCRRMQAGRTPAVPVGRMRPGLASSRSRSGPEFGREAVGRRNAITLTLANRFSTRRFVSRPSRFLLSAAQPASRPGPGRCSSRRQRCEALRGCESGSCRGGS
jgi:hypothetical protein